jgi:hypothetical protein
MKRMKQTMYNKLINEELIITNMYELEPDVDYYVNFVCQYKKYNGLYKLDRIGKKVIYGKPNEITNICYVRNDDRCIDLEHTADKIYKRKPLQPLHSVKLGNFTSSCFEYATCDIYKLPTETETEYVLK